MIKNTHKTQILNLPLKPSPPVNKSQKNPNKTEQKETPKQNKNIQNLIGWVHEVWPRAGAQHYALLLAGDSANANDPIWADGDTISDPQNISNHVIFYMCSENKTKSLHYKLQTIGREHISVYLAIRN